MFPNLKAEMARHDLSYARVAVAIGRNTTWLDNRLRDRATLSISEAILIHDKFFPDMEYDYLFAAEPIDATKKAM